MKNFSPLQNFKKENFYKYPFPHLIIDNAVQDNVYEELSNNFPEPHENLDDYDNTMFTAPFNHIFKNENIKNIWKDFLKYFSSKKYYNEVIDIFGDYLVSKYPKEFSSKQCLKELSISEIKEEEPSDIQTYGRVMYYSKVQNEGIPKKIDGSNLEIHSDGANKLFTALLYFKDKDDNSTGGDLALYRWRFKIPLELKKIILARSLNPINYIVRKFQFLFIKKEKIVTYKPNTLIIFLGSEDSLHSVEKRLKNSPLRKSVHAGIHFKKNLWDGQSLVDKFYIKVKNKLNKK